MIKPKRPAGFWVKTDPRIFCLQVCIIEGPITKKFLKRSKGICRTIEIRGDQTLEALHDIIFTAFDRDDPHMYEFQIGGKGPMDPDARRYELPLEYEEAFGGSTPAGTVYSTMGSLDLNVGDIFGYWFDFGDDWWHWIRVLEIRPEAGRGKYPKITNRIGASPPQYADWDEDF